MKGKKKEPYFFHYITYIPKMKGKKNNHIFSIHVLFF